MMKPPEEDLYNLQSALAEKQVIFLPVNRLFLDAMERDASIACQLMEAHLQHKRIINILVEECQWQDTVLGLFETWPRDGRPVQQPNVSQRVQQFQMSSLAEERTDYGFLREDLEQLLKELRPFLHKDQVAPTTLTYELENSPDLTNVARDNPIVVPLSELISPEEIPPYTFYLPTVSAPIPILIGRQDGEQVIIDTIPESFIKRERNILIQMEPIPQQAYQLFGKNELKIIGYDDPVSSIKVHVERAEKILLFIPGLTETYGSISGGFVLGTDPLLQQIQKEYDLILYYSYDLLYTSFEENAKFLSSHLSDVGLGRGHEKTLVTVGISIGGLLSRYFVEAELGNEVIQHLILVGTPNQGSPFDNAQSIYRALLASCFADKDLQESHLDFIANYYRESDELRIALDVSKHNKALGFINNGRDPGIPYTLIAGQNSNQIAMEAVRRSMKYLDENSAPTDAFREVMHWLEGANDGLFATASMLDIPGKEEWDFPPEEFTVESNTFSYLKGQVVLEAIIGGPSMVETYRNFQGKRTRQQKSADIGNKKQSDNSGKKELAKKEEIRTIKQIRFGPNTDDHDFEFKLRNAQKFLEQGARVKAYVHFYGRTIEFTDRGEQVLDRLIRELEHYGFAEGSPKMEGKKLVIFISPRQ